MQGTENVINKFGYSSASSQYWNYKKLESDVKDSTIFARFGSNGGLNEIGI